ncbi:MAG: phage portal protein [Desulfuromonadales bacterium]|nr:phage portal protein [Desulfuromonadales bacterium]
MGNLPRTARMRQMRLNGVSNQMLVPGGRSRAISRTGGGYTGAMGNWTPRRINYREEGRQRELLANRAADLVANDPHACSLIDSINVNAIGPGLWPQSKPNWKRLGITEEQATEIAEQAEWEFELWNREADARGLSDFYGIQFQNLWSTLVNGEFLNLPLMLDDPARRYRLALQVIDPSRLRTPSNLGDNHLVRDGIRLGNLGQAAGYFIADPSDGRYISGLPSSSFVELPPKRGHRHVVMHRFHAKEPEQVRGYSILAPAMSFFRNLADYLDYELVGAIVAASFPVFVEKTSPYDAAQQPGVNRTINKDGSVTHHRETPPGQILYGNAGEKPHILKGDRPGNSFEVFLEKVLRGAGAAAGMPYELVAKDFSKTNYSSARAALQEAWRVFELYQDWMVGGFCQPNWEMFFEEAVLIGRIVLPAGAPDFYEYRAEYCASSWVGPERTNVDPVKEMVADIMGLNAGTTTLADIAAKRNKDWEAQANQRARERKKLKELGLNPDAPSVSESKNPVSQAAMKMATEEETA